MSNNFRLVQHTPTTAPPHYGCSYCVRCGAHTRVSEADGVSAWCLRRALYHAKIFPWLRSRCVPFHKPHHNLLVTVFSTGLFFLVHIHHPPLPNKQTQQQDTVEQLQDAAIEYEREEDSVNRRKGFNNLERMINYSKSLVLKMPSPVIQRYIYACQIASLLRLDPERDKELIELKKRIQWICMNHRFDAVPPLQFFHDAG